MCSYTMEERGGECYICCWHIHWLSMAAVIMASSCSLSSAVTPTTTISVCPADTPQSTAATMATDRDQFFLNTVHPVDCNGTVVAWKLCYYLPSPVSGIDNFDETLFTVTLGVWRISSSGNWYLLVGFLPVEELGMDLQGGFNCITYPATEQFDVKPGDLVGFHTHNADPPSEVLELRAMTTTGERLTKRKDSGFCQYSYPGLPVSVSCFENATGAMHVHVMVEQFEGINLKMHLCMYQVSV